jgi:uncharacterized protein (TIGR03066 family)
MNTARTFVALAALLALRLGAPAQDPTKTAGLLIGKWDYRQKLGDAEATARVEFTQDGKILMKVNAVGMEFAIEGTYRFVNGDTIETAVTFMNETKTEKAKIKIDRDTLELTDPRGKVEKFTRAR